MKKALVVGIDFYNSIQALHGCVNDAHEVKSVLERNSDGSVNFDVKLMTATGSSDPVSRAELKDGIKELFADDADIALLFFAGHGHIEKTGGYLVSSDCKSGDEGVPLVEVLKLANESRARNKIIVLDSCHSGMAGTSLSATDKAELSEGLTILAASTAEQYSTEENGAGVFTTLFVDALSGAAGNLVGDVTPGSIYSHIDQSLGPWEQRPVFKTNVKNFVSLRKVQPPISLAELREIVALFPKPGHMFPLDPSFEPERAPETPADIPAPNREHTRLFALLQKFVRVNLVVPVDAPHMWHAAMGSKSCRLTVLGEHYRRLVEKKRI